ncbi:MAG: hypothetical protein IJW29_05190 [Clostridia bacterium]|nr:hypothetical protein [Clostridia bacterium]
MKKFLSLILALCMMLSCMLLLSACDKKEDDGENDEPKENLTVEAPSGYKAWSNEAIGFAYPSAWSEVDTGYAVILIMVQDQLGNSINALSEAKNTVYSTVTNENFMEVMGPSFEMVGSNIADHAVTRFKLSNDMQVIRFTFKNTMKVSGVSVTVYQAQYYVNVGARTYAITATGRSETELLAIMNVLESTLVAAK